FMTFLLLDLPGQGHGRINCVGCAALTDTGFVMVPISLGSYKRFLRVHHEMRSSKTGFVFAHTNGGGDFSSKARQKIPIFDGRLLRRGTNSFSGLSGIGSAGSRQNALHSVVSLVTRVFDQTVIRMPQRDLHGPWFEPRVRIVER